MVFDKRPLINIENNGTEYSLLITGCYFFV
jgi:hypothetical protein